jgi:hypothetical protein
MKTTIKKSGARLVAQLNKGDLTVQTMEKTNHSNKDMQFIWILNG